MNMTFADFDDQLRECRGKRCARNGVAVYTKAKYCTACGSKMKPLRVNHNNIDGDLPPNAILETATPADELCECGHDITVHYSLKFGCRTCGPCNIFRPVSKLIESNSPPANKGALTVVSGGTVTMGPPTGKPAKGGSDTFICDADTKGCPVEIPNVRVDIPYKMFQSWIFLAGKLDTEWMAYLKGELSKPEHPNWWRISEMYFPKQKVQAAHVEAEDGEVMPDTMGTVHSHVGMNAYFSAEDEKHLNHTVEMVINRRSDIVAKVRVKLDCGRYQRVDAKVFLIGVDAEVTLLDELKAKLTQQSTTIVHHQQDNRANVTRYHNQRAGAGYNARRDDDNDGVVSPYLFTGN